MHLRYKPDDSAPERLVGRLLGSGNYSFVYELDSITSVKIARGPACIPGLQQELDALRLLHLASPCGFIPTSPYSELGIVNFRRGREQSQVQVLAVSGLVGIAASVFKRFETGQLEQVFKCLQSALIHAHRVGICQLDVRPSNIIVKEKKNPSSIEVQLCDWGGSRPLTEDGRNFPMGFWGCEPFAHDEIHGKDQSVQWKPYPKHDFASLAFTMVALIEDRPNEVLWPEFCRSKVNTEMLQKRRALSIESINGSDLNPGLKKVLVRYLPERITLGPATPRTRRWLLNIFRRNWGSS